MKLTAQRKVTIAVACLALIALAADRLFIGPPVLESAVAAAAAAAGGAPPEATTGHRPAPGQTVVSVAERLEALRASGPASTDAFQPPPGWRPEPEHGPVAPAPAKQDRSSLPQLTGVFPTAREAIINKQRVREGDVVDGWLVERIGTGRDGERPGVRVSRGERREELLIEQAFTNPRSTLRPGSATRSAAAADDAVRK